MLLKHYLLPFIIETTRVITFSSIGDSSVSFLLGINEVDGSLNRFFEEFLISCEFLGWAGIIPLLLVIAISLFFIL